MTREEKESLLREAVDILIKLDNHLMTSRDNAEFSAWVEDLMDKQGDVLQEIRQEIETMLPHTIQDDYWDGYDSCRADVISMIDSRI